MNWVVSGRRIKGMGELEEMKCRLEFFSQPKNPSAKKKETG